MFFKTTQLDHQAERLDLYGDEPSWAHFWEQGTGKSKQLIDTTVRQYLSGKINAVILVSPGNAHLNWVEEELPKHAPDEIGWSALAWHASRASTKYQQAEVDRMVNSSGVPFLSMTYDGAITPAGKAVMWEFMRKRKVLLALDESQRVKTPSAKRTKTLISASVYAPVKRILSGTPVTKGPFDVYSQVRFLDPTFWREKLGLGSFTAFQQEFGVMVPRDYGGRHPVMEVVDYKNLDKLAEVLKLISDRVTKDILGLPDKVYQFQFYELSAEQRRIYNQLRDECLAWLREREHCESCEGKGSVRVEWGGQLEDVPCLACDGSGRRALASVSASMGIVKLLRMQQVLCGYVMDDDGHTRFFDENPRRELQRELSNDVPPGEGHIIWAVRHNDIDMIAADLKRDGLKYAVYDGRTSPEDRTRAKSMFQDGTIDHFLATASAAGEALTLLRGRLVDYFNNSYKLVERLQSEDRSHRSGQDQSVLYRDLACVGTADFKIIKALRQSMDVASIVNGDKLKEWIV